MNIKRIIVGPLQTNCYIIEDETNCLIIDPGDNASLIKSNITKHVLAILVTHHHDDHIGALDELIKYYKVPSYSFDNLKEGKVNIDSFNFECIYFPGHRKDLVAFYFDNIKSMFVGDFVFKNSIGRCDLEFGDTEAMRNSIDKLLEFDPDIVIYPGHGPFTFLMDEIDNLNYFKNII